MVVCQRLKSLRQFIPERALRSCRQIQFSLTQRSTSALDHLKLRAKAPTMPTRSDMTHLMEQSLNSFNFPALQFRTEHNSPRRGPIFALAVSPYGISKVDSDGPQSSCEISLIKIREEAGQLSVRHRVQHQGWG